MIEPSLLTPEVAGMAAAVVSGILALIPALGASSARRAGTAVITVVVAVLIQDGFQFVSWQDFGQSFLTAATVAVASYKMILQPLVIPTVAKAFNSVGISAKTHG